MARSKHIPKHLAGFSTLILLWMLSPWVSAQSCDLHELIEKWAYEQALACLTEGRADPNQKNAEGEAPLNCYRTFANKIRFYEDPVRVEFVRTLIKQGADVNYRPTEGARSPLENLLADGGYTEHQAIIALMLVHGGDPHTVVKQRHYPHTEITPLLWAIKFHQHDSLDLLLAEGVDPLAVPVENLASPFMHAVYYHNLHALDQLISENAHQNDKGLQVWQNFIGSNKRGNKTQVLNRLIDANIQVDWQGIDQKTQFELFSQAYKLNGLDSHQDNARLITHLNFQPDANDNLVTWQMRVDSGTYGMVGKFADAHSALRRHLLNQPDVLNWQDANGQNLYHRIVHPFYLFMDQVRVLKQAGLEPNVFDNQGNTPLHITAQAMLNNQQTIEKYRAMPAEQRRPSGVEMIPDILSQFYQHALSRDLLKDHLDYQRQLLRYYAWLVEQGLDPNQANNAGETPADLRLVLTLRMPTQ